MVKSIYLTIVTFPSLIVAVHSFVINYNTPKQCGDVEISWTKPSTSAAQLHFPLLLHIIPFHSAAITQEIHGWNASMTSGSVVMRFSHNLRSGTEILLAVTDLTGMGVGGVSDLKNVGTSHDTSCLSTDTPISSSHFQTLPTPNPSDCPSLNVSWDGTVKSQRPTIFGFSPGQSPVNMDPQYSPLPSERSVLIKGTFTSISRVVVLFRDNDSTGPSWTSQFLKVGGMDQDGCSTIPASSGIAVWASPSTSTTASTATATAATATATTSQTPCDLRCSNKDAERVVGGALMGVFGFAILLYVIFAYRRWRHREAHGPPPDLEEVSSAKSKALPSLPFQTTTVTSDDSRSSSPSIVPASTKIEGPSDENEQQRVQDQENESIITITTTTPSSIVPFDSSPLSLPPSPLTRRRSWTFRPNSLPSISTEESNFLQFTEASSFRQPGSIPPTMHDDGGPVSRPDSPTLPELRSPHASLAAVAAALPSTPKTAKTSKTSLTPMSRSLRSQRSERRDAYLMLDPASEITVSAGEVYNSRHGSMSSWMSRASRVSRTSRKAQ